MRDLLFKDMKKCSKCLLPETYETIDYSDDNSCNICNSVTKVKKNIDWNERYEKLKRNNLITETKMTMIV